MLMEITEVMRQEISDRAYDRWEYRCENGIPGTPEEDWLVAEKEILWWHNPNRREHAKQFPEIINAPFIN